jgi:hypothetical protein
MTPTSDIGPVTNDRTLGAIDVASPYPGFSLFSALGQLFGSSPVSYGLGIAMTVFNHTPWGW